MTWKNKEDALFHHLKDTYIKDLKWSEGEYNHYDCYSEFTSTDIELKCRNKHYDELLIEKAKYEKLVSRAKRHRTIPVYISQTPQGIYAFNLATVPEPIWGNKGYAKDITLLTASVR